MNRLTYCGRMVVCIAVAGMASAMFVADLPAYMAWVFGEVIGSETWRTKVAPVSLIQLAVEAGVTLHAMWLAINLAPQKPATEIPVA